LTPKGIMATRGEQGWQIFIYLRYQNGGITGWYLKVYFLTILSINYFHNWFIIVPIWETISVLVFELKIIHNKFAVMLPEEKE
jgi:hypothetical protein